MVSFCYPPLVTDRDEDILPLAREACAEAGGDSVEPVHWKRSFLLNECPLFKKMRVSYQCLIASPAVEPAAATAPAGD